MFEQELLAATLLKSIGTQKKGADWAKRYDGPIIFENDLRNHFVPNHAANQL
jgi:hypothetical protein